MSGIINKYSFFNFAVGLLFYYLFYNISDAIGIYLGIKLLANTTIGNTLVNNKIFSTFAREKIPQDNIINMLKDFVFFITGWIVAKNISDLNN
jgi:hypothetical protein